MKIRVHALAVVCSLTLLAVACEPMPPPDPGSTTTTSTTTTSTTSTTTTTTSTTTTTVVPGPVGPRTRIATGAFHTCAITAAGGVVCWGLNNGGQLGIGFVGGSSPTPVPVVGLSSGIVSVVASWASTCALTSVGAVTCWGNNNRGQLGDGSTTTSATPVDVEGLGAGVTSLAAGTGAVGDEGHFCAVTAATRVVCWGSNQYGQLGNGESAFDATGAPVTFDPVFSEFPVTVLYPRLSATVPLGGVVGLAAGSRHSCAFRSVGDVVCWGSNQFGQLGDGTTTWRTLSVNAQNINGTPTAIAAGSIHTCVLVDGGAARCWGGNSFGQLGDGNPGTLSSSPVSVVGLAGATSVAAGVGHTCVIGGTSGTQVLCWGQNSPDTGFGIAGGQLGDGTTTDRPTPVAAIGLNGVTDLDGGTAHTCALLVGGAARCTGWNAYGQLGDGTTTSVTSSVAVVGLP